MSRFSILCKGAKSTKLRCAFKVMDKVEKGGLRYLFVASLDFVMESSLSCVLVGLVLSNGWS